MRILLCLLTVLFATSCTHVVFDMPQPATSEQLWEFPDICQGIYALDSGIMDSLLVERTTATFIEHSLHEIPLGSLDTMLHITLKDGLLYDAEQMRAEGVPYQVVDSLITYQYDDRHVVGLSDTLILKRCGKYLVVNSNFSDDDVDYWDVVLLEISGSGDMIVSTIGNLNPPGDDNQSGADKQELSDFGKIVPYEQLGENTFLFRPTKAQFLKMVQKNLFAEKQTYKKIGE